MKRAWSEVGSKVGGGGERAVRGLLERVAAGIEVLVGLGLWRGRAERIDPRHEDIDDDKDRQQFFPLASLILQQQTHRGRPVNRGGRKTT